MRHRLSAEFYKAFTEQIISQLVWDYKRSVAIGARPESERYGQIKVSMDFIEDAFATLDEFEEYTPEFEKFFKEERNK